MNTPLILVPGLMCDADVWTPLQAHLPALAGARIVDHGNADSITGMARRLLDEAPPSFALAGHSMGCRVALEALRLAPQRVSRLALLDTGYKARAPGAAGEEEARKRHALLDIARREGVRAMASQWVQGMLAPARLADAELVERIVAMFARKSAEVFAAQVRALLGRPDATPVLRSVTVPTLVLCGAADSWSPPQQHEEIAALLPRPVPVHLVADAGHMCTMEQPRAVAAALADWLQALNPAGPAARAAG